MPQDAANFYTELAPLLASVSRSFFLSIKFLPRELRAPIALAYLLARTSDTMADSFDAPAPLRLKCLGTFREMIEEGASDGGVEFLQSTIHPPDAAERELMEKIARTFAWLESTEPSDRADIAAVLRKIIRGQELDIERFGSREKLVALQNAAELDEYTFLVAGCVGEFWTRLCFRHLKNFARLDETRMCELGVNFGKGLQLVNILRDLPADLKNARCYLPADELMQIGVAPEQITQSPQLVRPVFQRWLDRAVAHLDDAFHYTEATRHRRLRFACFLPWYLGLRTLALLKKSPPLEKSERIKVPRNEVRAALLLAPLAASSDKILTKTRDRISLSRD